MATFSRSKGARSASPHRNGALRRSGSFGNLRKSTGTNRTVAASFDSKAGKHMRSSTADMGNIENEYIRNLQQQIYFLELEANYLACTRRDQSRKASAIPPRVTEEADRMMRKLRALQADIDDKASALARRESQVKMFEAEKDAALKRLRNAEEDHAAEKRQLVNEIVSLKKMSDVRERDTARREVQVHQFRSEADKGLSALQEAEHRLHSYRADLEMKSEDCNNLRIELEEKKADCLKLKTQLQEMDERFFDSQAKTKEELGRELREEIRHLRLQLKEKQISSDQDRTLRSKIQDDCTSLIKENAALAAQVVELRKQLDMERAHKEEKDFRRQANIQELVALKDSDKHLQQELERTRDILRIEQQKHRDIIAKLSQEEQSALQANLRGTRLRKELSEIESSVDTTNSENIKLKRDQMLLTDEVENLQAKMDEADETVERFKLRLEQSESRCAHLDSKVRMERNLESIKWEEFEKMADTMREFSRNMGTQSMSAKLDYE